MDSIGVCNFWLLLFVVVVVVVVDLHVSQSRATMTFRVFILTLKVLNFWKLTSYCSLKPLWSGMGEVVPAHTSPTLPSPIPSHCASTVATSTVRVKRDGGKSHPHPFIQCKTISANSYLCLLSVVLVEVLWVTHSGFIHWLTASTSPMPDHKGFQLQ